MVFRKKKLTFDKVAKFNDELDSNEKLKTALKDLSLWRNEMSKKKYLSDLLSLFNKEGFHLSLKELDMLLLLRKKTDQMLLEEADDTNKR